MNTKPVTADMDPLTLIATLANDPKQTVVLRHKRDSYSTGMGLTYPVTVHWCADCFLTLDSSEWRASLVKSRLPRNCRFCQKEIAPWTS